MASGGEGLDKNRPAILEAAEDLKTLGFSELLGRKAMASVYPDYELVRHKIEHEIRLRYQRHSYYMGVVDNLSPEQRGLIQHCIDYNSSFPPRALKGEETLKDRVAALNMKRRVASKAMEDLVVLPDNCLEDLPATG